MNNTQKLFQAVKDGNFQEFMHLVNEGADIYAHDEQGHSLRYYAEGCGFASILEALEMLESVNAKKIEEPDVRPVQPEVEDVAVVESEPSRPQAMSKGDILQLVKSYSPKNDEQFNEKKQVLDLLTGKELDVNKLILNAVLLRSQELIQFAIDKNADVDVCDGDGTPLIVCAAKQGMVDVVKMLIAAGSYVNAKDIDGKTALYWAAYDGHVNCVKVLLESGADVDAKDSALRWAANKGHVDCVKVLLEAGAGGKDSALRWAAMMGRLECVKVLLEAGAGDEYYALRDAAGCGRLECVKALLEAGAGDKDFALRDAAKSGHLECVKALLEAGEGNKDSALCKAVENGHLECVKALLEAGADVNVKMYVDEYPSEYLRYWPQRDYKMTALDLARHYKKKEIAKLLKQAGGKSFWYGPVGYVLRVFFCLFFWVIAIGFFLLIIGILAYICNAIFD